MKFYTLEDVFIHEIQDLYSAEEQLTEALPRMVKAAESEELSAAFEEHLLETREQLARVQHILERLDKTPGGETCVAMKGIIAEGEKVINEHTEGVLRDVAIIAAAQRVEHYEIAAYGTARTLAKHIGNDEARGLLEKTLEEEASADKKLTKLAEGSWIERGLNRIAARK